MFFLPIIINHYQHCWDRGTTNLSLKDFALYGLLSRKKAVVTLKRPNPPSQPILFLDIQHLFLGSSVPMGSLQMSCP